MNAKTMCDVCGAPGANCCGASLSRRETADSLARLVERQSATITRLTRELDEARQVTANIRAKAGA